MFLKTWLLLGDRGVPLFVGVFLLDGYEIKNEILILSVAWKLWNESSSGWKGLQGCLIQPPLKAKISALRSDPTTRSFFLLGLEPLKMDMATSTGNISPTYLPFGHENVAFFFLLYFLLLYIKMEFTLFQFVALSPQSFITWSSAWSVSALWVWVAGWDPSPGHLHSGPSSSCWACRRALHQGQMWALFSVLTHRCHVEKSEISWL